MHLFSTVLLWLAFRSELTCDFHLYRWVLCFFESVFHLRFLLLLLLQMDRCFQLWARYAFLISWKYVPWVAFCVCRTAGEALLKLWPGSFRWLFAAAFPSGKTEASSSTEKGIFPCIWNPNANKWPCHNREQNSSVSGKRSEAEWTL